MEITYQKILNKWTEYTLTNDNGMRVSLLNFGGIITKIVVPNRKGTLENVVLGYKNYEEYEQNPNCFGAIIGRVAGRMENASFHLDGHDYKLEANEGKHHLHGGATAFHKVIWDAETFHNEDEIGIKLSHSSPNNKGGYPGQVDVTVTYTLTNNNELLINYYATSTENTVLTLTNHTYFNLTGNLKDTIGEHIVTMNSHQFLELDDELIPTGKRMDVTETPFDFRHGKGKQLSEGLNASFEQNEVVGEGYDHYFLFDQDEAPSISVKDSSSGRRLDIQTDQPGVVMYTANGLDEGLELREGLSKKHLGVCFETQGPPASLHHPSLPSITLDANKTYQKQTTFSFSYE